MYRGRKVYECPSRQTSQDELVRYMTGYSELAAEGGERQL
jgi:hypothetical protein